MDLVFICPETNQTFKSANFSVHDNKGIVVHSDGTKTLDAKVSLNEPCPYCGQKHVYKADQLPCPFGSA